MFRKSNAEAGKESENSYNHRPNSKSKSKFQIRKAAVYLIAAACPRSVLFFGLNRLSHRLENEPDASNKTGKPTPPIIKSAVIPVRVIDPLGGEDEDDLDDLIASWKFRKKN